MDCGRTIPLFDLLSNAVRFVFVTPSLSEQRCMRVLGDALPASHQATVSTLRPIPSRPCRDVVNIGIIPVIGQTDPPATCETTHRIKRRDTCVVSRRFFTDAIALFHQHHLVHTQERLGLAIRRLSQHAEEIHTAAHLGALVVPTVPCHPIRTCVLNFLDQSPHFLS